MVLVRLLLRHLLIPFLETGSSTIFLPHDVFSTFFCLLLGPCILAGHFVFTWDVQTLVIVYMAFVVYGYCLWLCVWTCVWICVYGCVFMAMDLWICMDVFLAMCLWLCVWLCVYGYVYGYVYGCRVSILREAWFDKHRGLPLLGARFGDFWDLLLHEAHFHQCWDLLLHEAHFIIIGSYSFTRSISANPGSYSFPRPSSTNIRVL